MSKLLSTCSLNFAISNWIGRNLSFWWEVDGKLSGATNWWFVPRICSNIFTKYIVIIFNIFLVDASQKPTFLAFRKWKMIFSCNKVENFLCQNCLPCQDAHVCTIWEDYHKLCHSCGPNIDRVAWKPRNFILDSSFWDHFLKILEILQVCYFS